MSTEAMSYERQAECAASVANFYLRATTGWVNADDLRQAAWVGVLEAIANPNRDPARDPWQWCWSIAARRVRGALTMMRAPTSAGGRNRPALLSGAAKAGGAMSSSGEWLDPVDLLADEGSETPETAAIIAERNAVLWAAVAEATGGMSPTLREATLSVLEGGASPAEAADAAGTLTNEQVSWAVRRARGKLRKNPRLAALMGGL